MDGSIVRKAHHTVVHVHSSVSPDIQYVRITSLNGSAIKANGILTKCQNVAVSQV